MTPYQQYIYLSRYARNGETSWEQTVDRATRFLGLDKDLDSIAIVEKMKALEVLPSMRLIATAGSAAERDNSAIYNCSYLPIKDTFSFSEVMYNLMCRVGVGFSVELHNIAQLPSVPTKLVALPNHVIAVGDNRIGWCTSFNELLLCLYSGYIPKLDYSALRPKGTPLATFMGMASGPEALRAFFEEGVIPTFVTATGRKLIPLEVYDLLMKCAMCVEAGGTQNTAMMCLFSLEDTLMLNAKSGNWFSHAPHRRHSNNSVVLTGPKALASCWHHIQNGELGFFNRAAAMAKGASDQCGLNPCGEVILEPFQYCNLTEVVCRPKDTFRDIQTKLLCATKLGAMQSKITNFRYIRPEWSSHKKALLGVSLTGIYDCPMMYNMSEVDLTRLYSTVKQYSSTLGEFSRVTCIKPSGTVSQLVGCSSGINPYISEYYLRVVRQGAETALASQLKAAGVPYEVDYCNPTKVCFYFPQKAVHYEDISMEHQFSTYLRYASHYTDHNPSISLYVSDWERAKALVLQHIDDIIGMAFVEKDLSSYQGMQLPVTPCDRATYEKYLALMPAELNLSNSVVVAEQVSECAGNSCKIS